jgi:hypothetical protein
MRYSTASLGAATVIWAAPALLVCTTALGSTAQADPVPLESATLQGDEVEDREQWTTTIRPVRCVR